MNQRAPARLNEQAWIMAVISLVTATAEGFFLFVLFWIAEPQGWSGAQLALIVLTLRAPALVGGIVGGRAVDRLGAKRLMVIDLLVRGAVLAVLAATPGDSLNLASVLIGGLIMGAFSPITYAGIRALVPSLSLDESLTARANALLTAGDQLSLLLGAALVGPAIEALGAVRSMLIPTVLMGVALFFTTLLRIAPQKTTVSSHPYDAADETNPNARAIKMLIGLSVVYFFAYGPFETVLPALIRGRFEGGANDYGLLWFLFGIGSLLTVPLAPRLAGRRPGLINALGAALWGTVMLPLVLVTEVSSAAVIFLAGGLIWGPYSAVEASALQRWTPPESLGRIFGLQRSLLLTAAPLGAAVGALSLDHIAPTITLGVSAGACAAGGVIAFLSPSLRRGQ